MNIRYTLSALCLLPSLCGGEVVISELSGASSDRLLKYSDSGQVSLGAGTPWFHAPYHDSGWVEGTSPFGFGYGGVSTSLSTALQGNAPSLYLRKSFNASAAQAASLADLVLTTEFDDGVIVFINGIEVARCNLGAPGMFIYSDQVAFNEDSAVGSPVALNLGRASDLLVEGENVIAVQVANREIDSPMFFGGSLRIDAGVTLLNVVSEDFSDANGAFRTHTNLGGVVSNTTTGSPFPGGWLDRSPLVASDFDWVEFEVRTLSEVGGGESGDGAISYLVIGDGTLEPATVSFPAVSMNSHWDPGAVSAAQLSETRVSFCFKGDPDTIFDFAVASPDGVVIATGFPVVEATSDETLGYWRFDDGGASNGSTITLATDSSGNGFDAGPGGSGGGMYSTDVPGAVIFDPLANASRSNQFSMDASASNRRMSAPNRPEFNTSFTIEMFIKIDEEPSGYNSFLRRQASGSSRWQIDFDHAGAGAFGRIRSRLDTPMKTIPILSLGPLVVCPFPPVKESGSIPIPEMDRFPATMILQTGLMTETGSTTIRAGTMLRFRWMMRQGRSGFTMITS